MKEPITLVLMGEPGSKKNSSKIAYVRRYNPDTGRREKQTIIVPSDLYKAYERAYGIQIPSWAKKHIDYPVTVKAIYYRSTRRKCDRPNLENALLDMLVKYGVLDDDNRDIVASNDGSRVYLDKENPRTEVTITPFEEPYDVWGRAKKCSTYRG